jgi:hypothetical protein
MSDEAGGEDWRARAEQAEAALMAAQAAANARLVQADLKAAAIQAGMVDLDGLKLIDMGEVRLSEAGEVVDAGGVLAKLKRAKPYLFGGGMSSSAAATAPRPEPARVRHANELTHAEWVAARAALLKRR